MGKNTFGTEQKILLGVCAVLFGLPVILILTLVEVLGLVVGWRVPDQKIYDFTEERCAMLDKAGHIEMWPAGVRAISNFNEGLAAYAEGTGVNPDLGRMEEWWGGGAYSGGFMDLKGNKHPLRKWWLCKSTRFSEGICNVQDPYDGGFCYVNANGMQRIEQKFKAASPFSEGLAAVCITKRDALGKFVDAWGYIDRTGEFVIPPRFSAAGDFVAGRAIVHLLDNSKLAHVIDKNGTEAFTNTFDEIGPFSVDGVAVFKNREKGSSVYDRGRCGLIDTGGKILVKGVWFKNFSEGLGQVDTGRHVQFADAHGKIVLTTTFNSPFKRTSVFGDGLAAVDVGSLLRDRSKYASLTAIPRLGFIDRQARLQKFSLGDRIITAAYPFKNGQTVVKTCIAKARPD